MRFATLPNGTPDGRLHIVSRDNARCTASTTAATLQAALEDWDALTPKFQAEYDALNTGGGEPFEGAKALAPLPRAWQWLDGSAYENHADLMQTAFNLPALDSGGYPLMYQGISNQFLANAEDVPMRDEADGIDFEGEFGVITKAVPMGKKDTAESIALVIQINDWSLRVIGPREMKTGFGWIQAKPACAVAPVAITPDELGDSWRDCRVDLPLNLHWNGEWFGSPNGYPMSFGLDELVAHGAYSRALPAGTVVGTGTVSNTNYDEVGSACIAERRAIELVKTGEASTPFMSFNDSVRLECTAADGSPLFGAIEQKVVKADI